MAERTHDFATFEDGACRVAYVYDDASGEVLRIIAVNTHPTRTLWARVERMTGGWSRERTWGPDSGTTTYNVPPGQRHQFPIAPDGRGPEAEGEPDYYDTIGDVVARARARDG